MTGRSRAAAAAAVCVATLAGCNSTAGTMSQPPASHAGRPAATNPAPSVLRQVHDPGHVTGTLTGPCYTRDGGQLPDPRCTPGSIDPAITQADIRSTICRTGYTKTVRPPAAETTRFKFDVAAIAYGIAPETRGELDHLIPLELAGANDATNLWIEQGPVPNVKDETERALNRAVCSGRVSLRAAQAAIARDWTTSEHVLGIGGRP